MEKKASITLLRGRELYRLKKELKISAGGVLQAEAVVKAARNAQKYPSLHSWFDWDDRKAAHEHRLRQARELLVSVQIIPPKSSKPIQAFVSLKSDRLEPGGGYRETVSVMGEKELRDQLLQQAWDEFSYWRQKYEHLRELAPIFAAADKVAVPRKRKTG